MTQPPRQSTAPAPRRFSEVGVDHGGRTYTAWELELEPRWRLGPGELTALSHVHTRLLLNLEDLEGAVAELEASGRPVWARQFARRLKWLRELQAKVDAEAGGLLGEAFPHA